MSDTQFKEEVSRRVAAELKRLEQQVQQRTSAERKPAEEPRRPTAGSGPARVSPPPAPAAPSEPGAREEVRVSRNVPAATPPALSPTAVAQAREPAVSASTEPMAAGPSPAAVLEESAKIKRIVKPIYPAAALRARIGGTVLLRVLVSETGEPIQVDVIRGVRGGLSEAAAAAVKRWTFEPARRNGVPVQSWTTIPIPFEP
jgi:protein TonB